MKEFETNNLSWTQGFSQIYARGSMAVRYSSSEKFIVYSRRRPIFMAKNIINAKLKEY